MEMSGPFRLSPLPQGVLPSLRVSVPVYGWVVDVLAETYSVYPLQDCDTLARRLDVFRAPKVMCYFHLFVGTPNRVVHIHQLSSVF